MSARRLAVRPNLDNLKKQARQLLKACQSGEPDAYSRVQDVLPPFSGTSDSDIQERIVLTDAQSVVALEYGFASWTKLKHHVESVSPVAEMPQQQIAQALEASDGERLRALLDGNPVLQIQIVHALRLRSRFHNLLSRQFPARISSLQTDVDDLLASGIADVVPEKGKENLKKVKSACKHVTALATRIQNQDETSGTRLGAALDALTSDDPNLLSDFLERDSAAHSEILEATRTGLVLRHHVTHEIRTPFNAIIGFSRLLRRDRDKRLTDSHKIRLETVITRSQKVLELINDLLDLTRVETGQVRVNPETFEVADLIDQCVSKVSASAHDGVELNQDVPDDIGQVNTDVGRLRQVLFNLLWNALNFTGEGRVTVSARRTNGHLRLSVNDTGKGIPEEALPSLFDVCEQVERNDRALGGWGLEPRLGISLTKRLTELLGGTISVESEVGEGSTFTVRVPADYGRR